MEAWNGAVVDANEHIYKEDPQGTPRKEYALIGWDSADSEVDAKVKEAIWQMEQDPMVGTYYQDRKAFDEDWMKKEYEPAAAITFNEADVYVLNESNAQKLARLISSHPDLPIISMVDADIIGDDCGRWVGSIGNCRISEYVFSEYGAYEGERIFWKYDADDLAGLMAEDIEGDNTEALMKAWEKVNAMPWKKAIELNIDLPDAGEV